MTAVLLALPAPAGGPAKFDREKYFPAEWDTGADRFCHLFHRYSYIYKPLSGGNWLTADESWRLTDTEILKAAACVHPKYLIGTRFAKSTRHAVIDIDSGSIYHNVEQIAKIRALLEDAGIRQSVTYRSSASGGWHMYIFFQEQISSRDLHKQLQALFLKSGFLVQRGQLEIFPNPGQAGSQGFALRMPLQPGFAWLDQSTLEITYSRDDLYALEAVSMFLADFENFSNTAHDFHQLKRHVQDMHSASGFVSDEIALALVHKTALSSASKPATGSPEELALVTSIFKKLPPGIDVETWLKGRKYFGEGLTGPGQRADSLFSVGHYLFYGDPQSQLPALGYGHEDQREQKLQDFLLKNHNGNSVDLNNHHSDALRQAERLAHWRPSMQRTAEHEPYTHEVPISWILENARRKKDARARIEQAQLKLTQTKAAYSTNDLRRAAGCSWTTLYKHRDIWDQRYSQASSSRYEQIADDLFSSSTHEYNVVIEAASCPASDSSTDSSLTSSCAENLAGDSALIDFSSQSSAVDQDSAVNPTKQLKVLRFGYFLAGRHPPWR